VNRRIPALALTASLLAFAGCGGGDPDTPSEPPAELLSQAFANPAQSGVAAIDATANLEGSSLLAGTVEAHLNGAFERAADGGLPAFDLEMDAEVAGFGVDGDLVSTGEDAFVGFFGETYRVGADRVSAAEQRLAAAGGAGGLGLDPAAWFASPRYAGAEDVEGTEAERIEAELDEAAMARDLTAAATALGAPPVLGAIASGAQPGGEVEAWIAYEDDTMRRLRVSFPFVVPAAQRVAASGISGGTAELGVELSSVGEEVEIENPAGGGYQPIEQLIGRLQDLASLGGL
jgi:hypothetical protein